MPNKIGWDSRRGKARAALLADDGGGGGFGAVREDKARDEGGRGPRTPSIRRTGGGAKGRGFGRGRGPLRQPQRSTLRVLAARP